MEKILKGSLALSMIMVAGMSLEAKNPPLDIAFVNVYEAMGKCDEGQQITEKLNKKRDELSKELEAEGMRIAQEADELNKKGPTLKPEVLAQNKRKLESDQRRLQEKAQESDVQLQEFMQEQTKPLAQRAEEAVYEVAKESGFDVVVDSATGRVVYSKDNTKGDLTMDAIAAINKKTLADNKTAPKKATTTA